MTPIRVIPLEPEHARVLSVRIDKRHAPDPAADARTDAAWDSLRRTQPSLFDGPVVLVDPPTASTPTIHGELSTYRHVATSAITGHSACSLGVKGLCIARDHLGQPHALIALRGSQTRVYPGLWELAPAGTVEPPAVLPASIGLPEMIAALGKEALEELSMDLPAGSCLAVALVDDPAAMSLDVLLMCELGARVERLGLPCAIHQGMNSEYAAAEWVSVLELPAWIDRAGEAIAPPTAAIVRTGWRLWAGFGPSHGQY